MPSKYLIFFVSLFICIVLYLSISVVVVFEDLGVTQKNVHAGGAFLERPKEISIYTGEELSTLRQKAASIISHPALNEDIEHSHHHSSAPKDMTPAAQQGFVATPSTAAPLSSNQAPPTSPAEFRQSIPLPPLPTEMCSSTGSLFHDDVSIAQYRHNKRAAVSFTFDDGQLPQFAFIGPTLEKHLVRGTFFYCPIFTGDIPWSEIDETQSPAMVRELVWNKFEIHPLWGLYALPMITKGYHEISSHSSYHKNFGQEIRKPVWYNINDDFNDSKAFNKRFFKYPDEVVTFAWPYGASNENHRRVAMEHFIAARGINCGINQPGSMDYSTLRACDFEALRGDIMLRKVNEAIKTGGYLVEFMHSIKSCGELPIGETTCPKGLGNVDPVEWEQHVTEVASMKDIVWIDTFGNVTKYLRERENTNVEYVQWIPDVYKGQISLRIGLHSTYNEAMHGLVNQPVKLTLAIPLNPSVQLESDIDNNIPRNAWPFRIHRIMNSQVTEDGKTVKFHQEHDYMLRERREVEGSMKPMGAAITRERSASLHNAASTLQRQRGQPEQAETKQKAIELLVDFLPHKQHLTILDIVFERAPCQ